MPLHGLAGWLGGVVAHELATHFGGDHADSVVPGSDASAHGSAVASGGHDAEGVAGAGAHVDGGSQGAHGAVQQLQLLQQQPQEGHAGAEEASAGGTKPGGLPDFDDDLKALEGGAVRIDLLNNNNSQYYGDFTIGDPKQRFTAVFDTGSAITWVPGAACKSDTCSEHHRFDTGDSASFQAKEEAAKSTGSIHYGTGEVNYAGGRDTINFCDSHANAGCHGKEDKVLAVPKQPFGMSTDQTSYPFRILPFDGILGLAPSGSKGSVVHQLKEANALDRNVLGVYLSEDTHRSGSMSFGGVETAHIAKHSPLHWHKISNNSEWLLGMKDILVDGQPLNVCKDRPDGICPAVVDTGSSLVTGPKAEIDSLLSKIRTDDTCGNLAKMPTVSLQLVDKDGQLVTYPLTSEEYTLRTLEEVPNTGDSGYFKEFPVLGKGGTAPQVQPHCEPGIGVMDVPGKKWVIGDTFLRRYYSIYDDDKGLVGFVRSVHPDEPPATGPGGGAAAAACPSSKEVASKAAGVGSPAVVATAALPPLPPLTAASAGAAAAAGRRRRGQQASLRRPGLGLGLGRRPACWTRFL